jgi:hypothetical protein
VVAWYKKYPGELDEAFIGTAGLLEIVAELQEKLVILSTWIGGPLYHRKRIESPFLERTGES